jgi:DNA (cytosine-5)-methyltransferase 1
MNELALFSGAGGGILGGKLLGWRTVCAVEWESYPASVLCARQNDGLLETFPIWDDVQTFDGHPWRGIVDVVSGGFPCTDISSAGKGAGIDGEASGMWREMARIIHEVRPRFVFVENSPMLTSRGLGRVLGDLAAMGFDARWGVLGAKDVGAKHQRDRIWIVATSYTNSVNDALRGDSQDYAESMGEWRVHARGSVSDSRKGCEEVTGQSPNVANPSEIREQWECSIQTDGCSGSIIGQNNAKNAKESTQMGGVQNMANPSLSGLTPCNDTPSRPKKQLLEKQLGRGGNEFGTTKHWWEAEPNVGRVVNGMASRVDRLKSIGNGQVPLCAATAWRILSERN